MTEQELNALVRDAVYAADCLQETGAFEIGQGILHDCARAITTLRAQLAEVQAELVRRVDMHECAMAERDDATLYGAEQKARADKAEAERAAQIERDAGICDEMHGSIWEYDAYECALSIRAQPRDRTALDRMLANADANALRRAALVCAEYPVPIGCTKAAIELQSAILALIERDATP